MSKLSKAKPAAQVHAKMLQDPAVRAEHARTALARAVAMRVLAYRTEHGLSQSAFARQVGMHQPAVARLEAGDHEPSLSTLMRLSHQLGIDWHFHIMNGTLDLRESA